MTNKMEYPSVNYMMVAVLYYVTILVETRDLQICTYPYNALTTLPSCIHVLSMSVIVYTVRVCVLLRGGLHNTSLIDSPQKYFGQTQIN